MSFWEKLFGTRELQPVEVIDADGQIEALLTNSAYKYIASRPGFVGINTDSYRKVFTVRRPTIEEFINRRQIKVEEYGASHHWLTLHFLGGKWIVRHFYPPEKGPGVDVDTSFATQQEAKVDLLTKLLANTQTGIRF